MCKKTTAVLALLLLLVIQVQGQIAEKANFFGGISYQFVGLTAPNATVANPMFYVYGLGAGMDYVLAHSNDVISLGINPNANLCFQLSNYYGLNLLASVPTYMLARVGAGATPFNEQKFGIGAGIGGSGSYFLSSIGINTLFFNPGAVVEMSLRTRGSNYLFRFNWSLMKPTSNVDFGGATPVPYRVGLTGISIFYTF
jgi:hypothetical protein